ncbi:RNA 2',3'-cyclic phosphodiesterase [Cellulomonas sp. APG4]|uniref:RNA 2',3'-cyclic phosphodiesterase n=1 Tax=Cellulomonas sp. APG4 TaxID=1538656 RepID=UPI0013795AFD|nr:RNA 2',3'-cyclic phosphodiesterase [Cellulomonas sp. APG4]
MRLFAAVRPPIPVLEHLSGALLGVLGPSRPDDVRWTAEENWHLTLAFYGEVPEGAVEELTADLAGVARATAPFELSLRGAGVFSHRTLWIGASGDVQAMTGLSAAAAAVGADVTGREDDRPRHRPHLTVGRVVAGRGGRARRTGRAVPQVQALVHALSLYEGPTWEVDHVLLVHSRPGAGRGGGPLYEDVARFDLTPDLATRP